jgi:hypothetical protein
MTMEVRVISRINIWKKSHDQLDDLGRGHSKETGNRNFRELLSSTRYWEQSKLKKRQRSFLNLRCSIQ